MKNKTHALYRFFGHDEELLYVGITMNPAGRWPKHRSDKPWWAEVATITVETFESRREALDAETEAIKTEHPRHNIAHAERLEEVRPAPALIEWTCYSCEELIDDGDGLMHVYVDDYITFREWRDGQPEGGRSLSEILDTPEPPEWIAEHFDCAGEVADLYSIAIDRLRTPAQILAVTEHLMGKTWFPLTSWERVLLAAARGGA